MITVYSKPRCMQCAAIITHLSKQGIDYQVRDAEQHSEEIIQLGYRQVPVVVLDSGETFSGFRPDRLTTP